MQINPRILLVMLAAALTSCGPGAAPMTVEQVPPPRPAIAGITVDSIEQLDAVAAAVDKLSAEVTVRLVFDPRMDPGYYATAVDRLGEHANLMGELLDSEAMTLLDVDGVRERANAYLTAFSDKIAIWEIGNELNGKWVGDSPAETDAKALAAFEVVKQHGGSTAITLNYWSSPDCYDHPWEQTVPFAQQLPDKLKSEVDYLLLSVYETACDPPQQPSAQDLAGTLTELGRIFPQAYLGIGEIGAQASQDGPKIKDPTMAERQRIAERYLGMHRELRSRVGSRFVGGYFWWYFCRDAVPYDRPGNLWPTLDRLLTELQR